MSRIAAILAHYGADNVPEGYGATWRKMLCPFHPDRVASAAVNEELDSFSCLACGVKGNVITLIMDREGCDARTAHDRATEIAGVESDSPESGRARGGAGRRGKDRAYVPPRLRGRAVRGVAG